MKAIGDWDKVSGRLGGKVCGAIGNEILGTGSYAICGGLIVMPSLYLG